MSLLDCLESYITNVAVLSSLEINLYLENPPQDQTDRWSGRPFRSLSVVHPPMPINLDPTQTEADKRRFLENLWHVQATFRSRAGQSVVLCADDQEVESKVGRIVVARTYFNVYQRTAFLQEPKKVRELVCLSYISLTTRLRPKLWFTLTPSVLRIQSHLAWVLRHLHGYVFSPWPVGFVATLLAPATQPTKVKKILCKPKEYLRESCKPVRKNFSEP